MLGTRGHTLLQSIAPSELLFSCENIWLWKETKRLSRAELHGCNTEQRQSEAPFQSPADAASTEIYLAPVISARKVSYFDRCKTIAFILLLFFGVYLVRGSVFLPEWPSLALLLQTARQWDCSTSLSAPVWEAYVASLWPLRSNTSNVSSSVSAPRLSNECKLLSQTNRLIHSRYSNCCFLLPYVLSLFQ